MDKQAKLYQRALVIQGADPEFKQWPRVEPEGSVGPQVPDLAPGGRIERDDAESAPDHFGGADEFPDELLAAVAAGSLMFPVA